MKFDAIIIGTGQAGPPLAKSLAETGRKVAIIEKSELGGTCVNVGCTPTKTYVASARRIHVARNSEEHGLKLPGPVEVDLKRIKERKEAIIRDSRNGLNEMLTGTEGIKLYKGKAAFKDANSVEVNGETLTAEQIFINTGARPRIPEGLEEVDFLTNESILELEKIPEHLIIIGGSFVGLEFGQMFRRFGSKVSILETQNQLLSREDSYIGEIISEVFLQEEIDIRLNTRFRKAKKTEKGIELEIENESGVSTLECTHVLVAAGRIPNTDDLGLEKAGVETDDRGHIKVNERLQTSHEHIWALGDCNGEGVFTHTSYNDFEIVHSHLLGDKKRKLSDRFPCYAAYIDPPVARVGMNEKSIREKGIKAKVASIPMKKVARAKEKGETYGELRIFIEEETDKILGAGFIGTGADEYIHSIIDIMYAGAPYTVIRDAVHIHPTVSELIPTMLEKLKPLD